MVRAVEAAISANTLVTGAHGFVGRALCRHLAQANRSYLAPARRDLDLADGESVTAYLARENPKVIFHLASGGVSPKVHQDHRLIARELAMIAHLVRAAAPGTRLIVAGSMAEYGQSGRLSEDLRERPNTIYGLAKLAVTHFALTEGRKGGLEVTVARLFGVYGPGEAPYRLFPTLAAALARGRPVSLSDGLQCRDFVHVDDAVNAMLALADCPDAIDQIVNVGTGQAVQVRLACLNFAHQMNANPDLLRFGEVPRRETDEDFLEADTSVLERLIGICPPQRFGGA